MTKRLAIIDGKSVFYRGYYAMPNLSTSDGKPTGGVYGFVSLAIELIKKLEPDYVAVAWDKAKTNIRKRREIYPGYKAGRKPAPADFYEQIPILQELLEAFDWPFYELDDYEADDIMGAFAQEAAKKGIETDLITSDLDALQLVGPLTKVYALKKGLSNIEEFNIDYFENKYGIKVEQFLDLKALKGDSSDNLPGVPGVGEKTAVGLLQKYETLDGIYEHLNEIKPTVSKKLKDGKELAYMSKKVGRIWVDAPIKLDWEKADIKDVNLGKVEEILKRLEFGSLIRRLPKHMQFDTKPEQKIIDKIEIKKVPWPNVVSVDGPVVLIAKEDTVWLSTKPGEACKTKASDLDASFWKVMEMAKVIGHDIKALYHQLAANDVFVEFAELHDINQAAFLINSLERDRSLEGLAGRELDGTIEEIAAMWEMYGRQTDILAKEPSLEKIAREFDFPSIYILFNMERAGIKIDTKLLAKMSKEMGAEHKVLEQEMYSLAGHEFNIASPKQLSEVLFTDLKLPTAGVKKGKTGYSTGQKELDKLHELHPIIELIERTRELAKLKNTYVDALPKLIDENDRLHTTFNQDVASTGRLSSTNPNLQNIPIRSEIGRKIRSSFIPEGDKVFISADYSQFELRLAAILSGDEEMINDFNGGVDIHTKTASEIYGVPMDNVTKSQRYGAKAINFGILYGMSPHGLAAVTGMSFGDAKRFIDKYFELRKPIRDYIEKTLKQAREIGYVETYFGRRRPTPDIHSSNFAVRQAAERAAINMPIQGTEADLMKLAMIKVEERMGSLGNQILQIHDSILVEAPKENVDKISDILLDTMENIAPQLKIKLKVEINVGENWGEL